MSVQNKPDYKIFADGAKPGEVVTFPDILRGWGVTLDTTGGIPPMEFFNSFGKRLNEWLMYLTQRGIPEWDSVVDYPKSAMVQHSGIYYISIKATKGDKPDTSQLSWSKLTNHLGIDDKYDKTGGAINGRVEIKTGGVAITVTAPSETSSSYMEFFGGGKRTAYMGYGSESTTAFTISNEKTGTVVRVSDNMTVNGYRVITEKDTQIPIGASVLWNSTAPIPNNFWPNEGRSFSASDYPDLAKVFPSLKLPDDRGYALRIADNGKGIDSGRVVGTYQEDAMQPMSGWMGGIQTRGNSYGTGVFSNEPTSTKSAFSEGASAVQDFTFNSSSQVRTANETRMKNVSKILITRIK